MLTLGSCGFYASCINSKHLTNEAFTILSVANSVLDVAVALGLITFLKLKIPKRISIRT